MTKEPAKTTPRPGADEYTEFEKLTRKLVRVPKREIDAERAKTNGKKPATP